MHHQTIASPLQCLNATLAPILHHNQTDIRNLIQLDSALSNQETINRLWIQLQVKQKQIVTVGNLASMQTIKLFAEEVDEKQEIKKHHQIEIQAVKDIADRNMLYIDHLQKHIRELEDTLEKMENINLSNLSNKSIEETLNKDETQETIADMSDNQPERRYSHNQHQRPSAEKQRLQIVILQHQVKTLAKQVATKERSLSTAEDMLKNTKNRLKLEQEKFANLQMSFRRVQEDLRMLADQNAGLKLHIETLENEDSDESIFANNQIDYTKELQVELQQPSSISITTIQEQKKVAMEEDIFEIKESDNKTVRKEEHGSTLTRLYRSMHNHIVSSRIKSK